MTLDGVLQVLLYISPSAYPTVRPTRVSSLLADTHRYLSSSTGSPTFLASQSSHLNNAFYFTCRK